MAGMRDRLIHDYFDVDLDLVWDVIREKILLLRRPIDAILATAQPDAAADSGAVVHRVTAPLARLRSRLLIEATEAELCFRLLDFC